MKILYLHGIGSGADSRTPMELRKHFPEIKIIAPELPARPMEAYKYIQSNFALNEDIDLVIGTSLGGFYALTLPMVKKLLVNPAMFADTDISNGIGLGKQPFFCVRNNGETEYEIDKEFINELAEIRKKIYESDILRSDRIDHNLINETYALFGDRDELLHHYDDFCDIFLKEHAYRCEAEHRLSTEEIHETLAPLVKKVIEDSNVPFFCVMDEDFWE